ncbi:MAG TPA: transporter [Acidimicrobiia bacterium]|nr:transporter [Acidimicrobiia bacterium]
MVALISGIGETEFSKDSGRSELRLNVDASLAALRDAGVDPSAVDGIVVPALVGSTAEDLMSALGLADLSYTACVHMGGAGPLAALSHARLAVTTGLARTVLVSFGHNGRSGPNKLGAKPPTLQYGQAPGYRRNYEAVHGLVVPAQFYALWAQRYMYEHSWTSTEPLAHVARIQSEYAVMNGLGYTTKPISVADHQESRMISSPFRLYDCSREADGGAALVVTAAANPKSGDVVIKGIGEGHPPRPDQPLARRPFLGSGMTTAAKRAFDMAGCTPAHLDFAELYDAFSFNVLWQLEQVGVCEPGGAAGFILGGQTEPGGRLPVNTHGGLLSQAHVWGVAHITEAVKQLRGTAGKAQVSGARRGLVTGSGDFLDAAAAILEAV